MPEVTNAFPLPRVKVKAFGLVRNGITGKPKIDGDPRDLHPSVKAALTEDEMRNAISEWDEQHGG